jgi:hypothetical protein
MGVGGRHSRRSHHHSESPRKGAPSHLLNDVDALTASLCRLAAAALRLRIVAITCPRSAQPGPLNHETLAIAPATSRIGPGAPQRFTAAPDPPAALTGRRAGAR